MAGPPAAHARDLFGHELLPRVARLLGFEHDLPTLARTAAVAVLLGWMPLLLLTAVQSAVLGAPGLRDFLEDLGVHARALLAVPLFVLADALCAPRLSAAASHFLDARLVQDHDRPRFDAAVASTGTLMQTPAATIVAVVLSYALSLGLLLSIPVSAYPPWHLRPDAGGSIPGGYSIAGWWHVLVVVPMLLFLTVGWLWRLWLWARFLWLVSRLELRLVPSHPDLCAGLKFLGYSVRGFTVVAAAGGTVMAGRLTNNFVHSGSSPFSHAYVVAIGVLAIMSLFLAPLLVFAPRLLEVRRRGVFEYGALADRLGRGFESRWLASDRSLHDPAVDPTDISALSDLYQIAANVQAMRPVPVDLGSFALIAGAVLLPFVPVVVLSLPLEELFRTLARFLL